VSGLWQDSKKYLFTADCNFMKQQFETLIRQALALLSVNNHYSLPKDLNIVIERPRDPGHGDYSTNIAMVLAKSLSLSPRVFAEQLIACMPAHPHINNIHVAGPGFINCFVSHQYLIEAFDALWQSTTCGIEPMTTPQTVVVDYSSPNLAKEMHVGHLRSTIIGDAIVRVLEYKGYQVIRQNHVGDWGTQFGMLLAHLDDEARTHVVAAQLNDLECFYKAAKLRFDEDAPFAKRAREWVVLLQSGDARAASLWSTFIGLSLAHCQAVYERLGVSLTSEDVRAESAYNEDLPKVVATLKQQGLLVACEGVQCVFLDEFKGKNDEPLPVIVQKSDGGFLYASTDLAAINYRDKVLHADRVLYVVDARQALHFQQIFLLAYKAGFARPSMSTEHVSFGMVLDKSGRPYKSRDGGVTKLADLLDEAERRAKELIKAKQPTAFSPEELANMAQVVGIASVKYADLSKNRISDYIFDWDTMLSFEGNTAPYLLYAFTRVQSLFQKAQQNADSLIEPIKLHDTQEITLTKHLLQFPEVIDAVVNKATPHLLCTYLYELAGCFSTFYEACPILNQEDKEMRNSRLKLAAMTARILEQGLSLLGIETLKRM
jgi:arginyl-tRNA synthetase